MAKKKVLKAAKRKAAKKRAVKKQKKVNKKKTPLKQKAFTSQMPGIAQMPEDDFTVEANEGHIVADPDVEIAQEELEEQDDEGYF